MWEQTSLVVTCQTSMFDLQFYFINHSIHMNYVYRVTDDRVFIFGQTIHSRWFQMGSLVYGETFGLVSAPASCRPVDVFFNVPLRPALALVCRPTGYPVCLPAPSLGLVRPPVHCPVLVCPLAFQSLSCGPMTLSPALKDQLFPQLHHQLPFRIPPLRTHSHQVSPISFFFMFVM